MWDFVVQVIPESELALCGAVHTEGVVLALLLTEALPSGRAI